MKQFLLISLVEIYVHERVKGTLCAELVGEGAGGERGRRWPAVGPDGRITTCLAVGGLMGGGLTRRLAEGACLMLQRQVRAACRPSLALDAHAC